MLLLIVDLLLLMMMLDDQMLVLHGANLLMKDLHPTLAMA